MNPNRRPGLADRIRDIPIGRRLMVAMGLILALSFASSVLAILSLQRMGHDVQAMVSGNVQTERRLADWLRIITNNVQRGTAISVSSDRSLPGYFAASAADDVKTANLLQQQIGSALDGPREHELFDRIGALRKTYLAARDAVFSARAAGDEAGAKRAFAERYEPTSKQYVDAMQAFMDLQRTQLDDEVRGLRRWDAARWRRCSRCRPRRCCWPRCWPGGSRAASRGRSATPWCARRRSGRWTCRRPASTPMPATRRASS